MQLHFKSSQYFSAIFTKRAYTVMQLRIELRVTDRYYMIALEKLIFLIVDREVCCLLEESHFENGIAVCDVWVQL